MKAIVKEKNGIFLRDIPIPRIKPRDVLIQVAIAAFCRTDGYIAKNKIHTKTPLVLGHEFSGTVCGIGTKVTGLKRGDRVAVMPISSDNEGYFVGPMLGVDANGAFAEYIAVPMDSVYKIPSKVSFREAAYLEPIAASLAVLNAPIKKDQRGCLVGKNRIAKLTKRILTIHHFKSVSIVSQEELTALPKNIYDFAIETIATSKNISQLTRVVKPGGMIILKSRQYSPIEISVGAIVKKDLRIFGTYYGSFRESISLLMKKKLSIEDIFGPTLPLKRAIKILRGKDDDYEAKKIFFDPTL